MKRGVTYEVSDVIFKEKKAPPIIAHFANGELNSHGLAKAECGIYQDAKDPAKYSVTVCCDNMLYMGESPKEGPFRTMLVIQDPGSNKVRMVEIEKVCLYPRHLQNEIQNPTTTLEQKSRGDLYKAFGSKQMKLKTEQLERMKLNVQTIADHLKETAEKANIDNANINDDGEYFFSHVPCNRNAINVSEVYLLEDIILPTELDSLESEAKSALISSKIERVGKYSEFFCEMIGNLPADNQLFRTKLLMFAECIVWFLKMSPTSFFKKTCTVCPVSKVINEKLLNTFTELLDSGRRLRPLAMKDKALSFLIVACLIALKFTFNLTLLSSSVQVSMKKLLDLSQNLGATPRKDQKGTIVLKLPLPPLRKPITRKKKSF